MICAAAMSSSANVVGECPLLLERHDHAIRHKVSDAPCNDCAHQNRHAWPGERRCMGGHHLCPGGGYDGGRGAARQELVRRKREGDSVA